MSISRDDVFTAIVKISPDESPFAMDHYRAIAKATKLTLDGADEHS